jgi:hypothetical protein
MPQFGIRDSEFALPIPHFQFSSEWLLAAFLESQNCKWLIIGNILASFGNFYTLGLLFPHFARLRLHTQFAHSSVERKKFIPRIPNQSGVAWLAVGAGMSACLRARLGLGLGLLPLPHCHWFTLLTDNVVNGGPNLLSFPQIPRASVASPSPLAITTNFSLVQDPAGIRLYVIENLFRPLLRSHHQMNVESSYMGCQQSPASVGANFLNGAQHDGSAAAVKMIGLLSHLSLLGLDPS